MRSESETYPPGDFIIDTYLIMGVESMSFSSFDGLGGFVQEDCFW